MPSLSALYADADLEIVMGGAYRLVEVSGATAQGDAVYTAFLARVRKGAQSAVYSIMQIAFDPLDTTASESDRAATLCLGIARYYAWSYGTGGQAIPPDVAAEKDAALIGLQAIRDGNAGMGTATDPASKVGAETVTITDTTRILRGNMGGFC